MDRFDYKIPGEVEYISSGIVDGEVKKPVAWGSKTAFSDPLSIQVGRGVTQLIVDPAEDEVDVLSVGNILVRFLQNGVYLVKQGEEVARLAANTGPVALRLIISDTEVYIVIDGLAAQMEKSFDIPAVVSISETGKVIYDKVIYDHEVSVESLINKDVKSVHSLNGRLMPLSADKWYEPQLVLAEGMDVVDGYNVATRKLTYANTSAAFYSDTTKIEKSIDAENWLPVDKVEYHGEEVMLFRSKDPEFAVKFFDTNVKEFIVPKTIVTVEGNIYKVGNIIGSLFSNDCYRIHLGSITLAAEGLSSVTILGYLPDEVVTALNPMIDYGGTNFGKMHLYTFDADESLTLEADEIYLAAIGINIDHEEVMDQLSGVSQISYADEIHSLQNGQSKNGENEYSILDLQWNV